jgi:hypothetical protein
VTHAVLETKPVPNGRRQDPAVSLCLPAHLREYDLGGPDRWPLVQAAPLSVSLCPPSCYAVMVNERVNGPNTLTVYYAKPFHG